MILIQDLQEIEKPFKKAVVAIGNFDGVHIGHQALFHGVIEKADSIGGTSVAITFKPHPIKVLKPNGHPPLITLTQQKTELIANSGIDVLICIPFTRAFAATSAREFVEDLLVKRIGMKAIVLGRDYTFGCNRDGNIEKLKDYSVHMGFEVIVSDWIQMHGRCSERISSTRIRELVMGGKVRQAQKQLGRNYQIGGTVTKGRDRGGKLLGFPTANINLHDELSPKTGVYAVSVACLDKKYMGVANIGYSPTFDDHVFTVEVHLLDFEEDIYGKQIRVNFIERIRSEKKFSSIHALSEQIKKDIIKAREISALTI